MPIAVETFDHRSEGAAEEEIVERIFEAVIEQRLPPGTKLPESSLCAAFGVSRMRVRRSLLLLASRHIVDLQSNRGAYILTPTQEEARQVFEARRAIEPSVCRIAAERSTAADLDRLASHVDDERQALAAGNRRLGIRLSGLFHVKLAEIAANRVMEQFVKELVTRTSLIIGMFGASGTANCNIDEHAELVAALRRGDQEGAARLARAHLAHIEAQVDLSADHRRRVDLIEILSRTPD